MVAADHVVPRCEGVARRGRDEVGQVFGRVGQVEGQGHAGQHVQEVREGGRYARGVEERGHGAHGGRGRGRVRRVAGVVLRAAAYGYVLEDQARADAWEGCRGYLFCLLVMVGFRWARVCERLTVCWHLGTGKVADWCSRHLLALLRLLGQHVEVLGDVIDGVTRQGGVEVQLWMGGSREGGSTQC